jgi:hypothetical protein
VGLPDDPVTVAWICRAVLGVLPRVQLQLPDDPPGLLHTVCCLLEAVASTAVHTLKSPPQPFVGLRLTLFASGAVQLVPAA